MPLPAVLEPDDILDIAPPSPPKGLAAPKVSPVTARPATISADDIISEEKRPATLSADDILEPDVKRKPNPAQGNLFPQEPTTQAQPKYPSTGPVIPGYGPAPGVPRPPVPAGLQPTATPPERINPELTMGTGFTPEQFANDPHIQEQQKSYESFMTRWGVPKFDRSTPKPDKISAIAMSQGLPVTEQQISDLAKDAAGQQGSLRELYAAVGDAALGLTSPESLSTVVAAQFGGIELKALANSPKFVAAISELPNAHKILKAIDFASRAAIPAAFSGKAAQQSVEAAKAGQPVDAIVNAVVAVAAALGIKESSEAVAAEHPTAEAAGAGGPRAGQPTYEAGVEPPPSAPQRAQAVQMVEELTAQGKNLAAQPWKEIAEYGTQKPVAITINDGKGGSISATLQPITSPEGVPGYQVVDAEGKIHVGGRAETVQAFLERETWKKPNPEAGGAIEVGSGVAEAGEIQRVSQLGPKSAKESAAVFKEQGKTYAELMMEAEQREYARELAKRGGFGERLPKASIPEEGVPEYTERVQDARERLAGTMVGKPWAEVNNSDRMVIDEFVRKGYGFAVQPAQSEQHPESTVGQVAPQVPQEPTPPAGVAGVSALPGTSIPATAPPEAIPPTIKPVIPSLNETVKGTEDMPLVTEVVKPGNEAPPQNVTEESNQRLVEAKKTRSEKGPTNYTPKPIEESGVNKIEENFTESESSKIKQPVSEAEPERKYSSTQVNLPQEIAKPVRDFGLKIPEGKLADEGRENEPHTTILYGIHSAESAETRAAIEGHGPIAVKIGKLSVFKTKDADVLKFDVESPDLHALNAKVAGAVEHTSTHPKYIPHITVAYLKPGEGKQYAGRPVPGVTGKTVTLDKVVFSPHEGEKSEIDLSNAGQEPVAPPIKATNKSVKDFPVSVTHDGQNIKAVIRIGREKLGEFSFAANDWPQPEFKGYSNPGLARLNFIKKLMEETTAHKAANPSIKLADFSQPESATMERVAGAIVRAVEDAIKQRESAAEPVVTPPAKVPIAATQTPASYKVMVKSGPGALTSNSQRFATAEEAESAAKELQSRWTGMDGYEIHPSDDKPNYRFDLDDYRSIPLDQELSPEEKHDEELREEEPLEQTGVNGLINAIYDKLRTGQSLGNVTELNKMAEQYFGASRASGVWTPRDLFDAMETGLNKYLLDRGPELLSMDPVEALAELRDIMGDLTTQATRTEEQIANQQFSTPPTESFVVAKVANIKSSDIVLEPSAGNGGIALWGRAAGAKTYVNEIAERRRQMLETIGFENPTAHDGELIHVYLDPAIQPTVVIMNPPFSASTTKSHKAKNRNKYGFNHVDAALQRLVPGGRLVAILGGGQANEPNGGASLTGGESGKWFDRLANRYNIRANIRVEGKEYSKFGTSFATRIIVIDKDRPLKSWADVVAANVKTLEEAYALLKPITQDRPQVQTRPVDTQRPGNGKPATGVAPGGNVGGPGGGEVPGEPGNSGGPQLGERPNGSPGGTRGIRPGAGGQRPPRVESTPQPEGTAEGESAGSPEGSAENPTDQREPVEAPPSKPLTGFETQDGGLNLETQEAHTGREEQDSDAYVTYRPTIKGPRHPGAIVETQTMATVPLPKLTYRPSLPDSVITKSLLSDVQLEAIMIAGQQNDIVLPDGARASALVGDGTGVGKGRIAAGILFDNWNKGRRRLVWVSPKWDLMQAAADDLRNIGAEELLEGAVREPSGKWTFGPKSKFKEMSDFGYGKPIVHDGILFTTYATMRGEDKKGNRRIDQIEHWLKGNDNADGGYASFDESHTLKNAVASQGSPTSKIGIQVKNMLDHVPNLRTVSLSATAATDVINLGYLDRLGLWGAGTAFPSGFQQFVNEIGSGGMSAMEMVARELKAQGKYVARTLSFKGVDYSEEEHTITPEQKELWKTASRAWRKVSLAAEDTIKNTTNGGGVANGRFKSAFYGAQLRFFAILLNAVKSPTAVALANKALAEGKSVVITLVNTNEAAQNREKDKARGLEEDDDIPEYDFGPKEMLVDLVREHYPVQQFVDDVDDNGKPIKVPLYEVGPDGTRIPVRNPQAIAERDKLIEEINRDLRLPGNPLDILVDALGGRKKVAELTGRKERFDEVSQKFVSRGDPNVPKDQINLMEMHHFQNGDKRIAILSATAGTGISLHAGNDVKNQQRRYHITLQVGWSADRQMQMFGRTHRTNQAQPPQYVMLTSDLGGEKRFVSTIARRLGSLGALTKGQKNAAGGNDLMEKVNFETAQGKQATLAFYNRLLQNVTIPGTDKTGIEVLTDMAVLKEVPGEGLTVPVAERTNITRTLNRMLALEPDLQNPVYNYFYDIFQAVVQAAIEDGTLDTGVKTLPGDNFIIKEQREIATDPKTGAKTFYYPVDAQVKTERVSVKDLDKRIAQAGRQLDNPQLITDGKGHIALTKDAPAIVHADGRITEAVYRILPGNGKWVKLPAHTLHRYAEVGEWAKDELEQAEITQKSKQGTLQRRRQDFERIQANERASKTRYAEEKFKTAVDTRERVKTETEGNPTDLATNRLTAAHAAVTQAHVEFTAAEKYELPEDHWAREHMVDAEEDAKKADQSQKEAAAIAADPQKWAREEWTRIYEAAPAFETVEHHLIGGAVLRYWNAVREASGPFLNIYTTSDSNTGQRIVGVDIPADGIRRLVDRISGGQSTVNAAQLITDVLRNGLTYELEGGIIIKPGRVSRETVIQVVPPSDAVAQHLKQLGVIYERGLTPIYYVPNGTRTDNSTHDIVDRILKNYPVKPDSTTPPDDDGGSSDSGFSDRTGEGRGERGQINSDVLTAGLNKFVEHDVVPTVKETAQTLAEAVDDIQKTFLPAARGGDTTRTAELSIREKLAEYRREMILAQKAVAKADRMFEKKGDEFSKNFILTYFGDESAPLPQTGDADMDSIARTIRALSDKARVDVQDLGTGKLRDYYINYFAHIWKDRRQAETIFSSYFGKRPLEGPKAFLKQRKYPNFKDAIEAGLEPVTWNPIRLTLMKIAEQERYVMAHRILNEWKKQKLARFVAIDAARPAGWRQIADPIGVVYGPRIQHITEYPNEGLYVALQKTVEALGLTHKRVFKMRPGAIGLAHQGKPVVETRHGTAEDVLAHEIGHQIDWLVGSGNHFMNYGSSTLAATIKSARQVLNNLSSTEDQKRAARATLRTYSSVTKAQSIFNRELRALADLRSGRKAYTHKREEKMALLSEMWVGARELFAKTAPTVFEEWKRFLDKHTALHALRDIQGNTEVKQISQPYDVGGIVTKGHWYAPEAAAHLLNNYLTPGLQNKGWYRALFGLNNVLNQFQLGLSAFHIGFTTMDAVVSKAALAIEAAMRGHPIIAAKHAIETTVSPLTTFYHGNKMLKEYELPGSQGAVINKLVAALVAGGGRGRMEEIYGTAFRDRMMHMFRNGNIWGGLWRAPLATVEAISDIIMRELVPRQKLGVFYDMARFEFDRLGPGASFEDIRDAMATAWDSVDNRMGQMVYDNLFWNKIGKDLLMLNVRSVGWNLGTIREVGGGAIDMIKVPIQIADGMPPEKVNLKRISYVLSMALIGAIFGAIYQYLATGKPPKEVKDLYFPQNGLLDEAGRPQRMAPPMYTTDVYHYSVDFQKTLASKVSPLDNLLAEMYHNEDFYHNKIVNGDDPFIEQMKQGTEYLGSKMIPLGIRNMERETRLGATTSQKLQQFVGMKPAPASVNQTRAERLASEIQISHLPAGGRTQQVGARYDAESTIAQRAASGRDYADIAKDYVARGILTGKEVHAAATRTRVPPLMRRFNGLGPEDALKVWDLANQDEKKELRPLMKRKYVLVRTRPPAERQILLPKFQQALAQ